MNAKLKVWYQFFLILVDSIISLGNILKFHKLRLSHTCEIRLSGNSFFFFFFLRKSSAQHQVILLWRQMRTFSLHEALQLAGKMAHSWPYLGSHVVHDDGCISK